jgi:CubicO group peptidase (beta-lactamase class C family)
VLVGAAIFATRDLPPSEAFGTGPLGEFDRMDAWIDLDALPEGARIHPDATVAHVLAMVGYSQDLAHGRKTHSYDAAGTREINQLVPVLNAALAQDPNLFGDNSAEAFDRLFQSLGMEHSFWGAQNFAYSWYASLLDMARVGLLVLRGGVWNDERLLDAEYVYNMTHPAFEDGSTSYGYLTWMNNLTCAPRAMHRSFPHGLSGATDCEMGNCEQDYDVGAWSAIGLGGQYIVGHRGLDLVIVARNWGGSTNSFWRKIVPAIVAVDPVYQGNESAFCQAYGSSSYAPDLVEWEGGW